MKKYLEITNAHGWTVEGLQEYENLVKNRSILKKVKVIRLIMQGCSAVYVANLLNIHRETVSTYVKKFNSGGMRKLLVREYSSGKPPYLSVEKEKELISMIKFSTPSEHGCDCSQIWNTRSLKCVLKRKFEITMSRNGIGEMLRRWGFKYEYPAYIDNNSIYKYEDK
ncbi:hypothetical protein IAW_06050 [Bacillus cereus str. Schrouff]|uniref:helix-turn-helix domain-containing protein n=1 Tax=Bacillus cereus TaxID=1396 RepID=UPI0003302509|nr:helix-turn-helix domain-containing protein [Bacillus cereus]EOO04736.1 hypothetical protein IAW_06050 [Bacillus cereus str. Schrouff]EOO81414.1 hypothetical protein IGY_05844 [Bacillus cereus K-5975c]